MILIVSQKKYSYLNTNYGVPVCYATKFRKYVFTFRRKLRHPYSRPINQQVPYYRKGYIQSIRVYNSRKKQGFPKLDTGSFRFMRQMEAQAFHRKDNSCFTKQKLPQICSPLPSQDQTPPFHHSQHS